MKKYISVMLAIGMVLTFGSIAMAINSPGQGIENTSHDLSTKGGNIAGTTYGDDASGKDRICVYCHAPHHTAKDGSITQSGKGPIDAASFDYLPLWNHAGTLNAATGFTMYSNGFMLPGLQDHQSQAMEDALQPGGISLLCLSCHDGSVGVNEYGFAPSGSYGNQVKAATPISGRGLIGSNGDLSNHHPIGFNYDYVQSMDQEIRSSAAPLPSITDFDLGGGVGGVHAGGPVTIGDLMNGGQMECTSCHDVHNTKNGGSKFTWVDDTNSRFCFTCHMKDGSTNPALPYDASVSNANGW